MSDTGIDIISLLLLSLGVLGGLVNNYISAGYVRTELQGVRVHTLPSTGPRWLEILVFLNHK